LTLETETPINPVAGSESEVADGPDRTRALLPVVLMAMAGWLILLGVPLLGRTAGERPAITTILGVGLGMSICMTATVYWSVVREMRHRNRVFLYTFAFNGLLVIIKFVASPTAVYDASALHLTVFDPFQFGGLPVTVLALVIFGAYSVAGLVIYLIFRARVRNAIDRALGTVAAKPHRHRLLVMGLIALAIIATGAAGGFIIVLIPVWSYISILGGTATGVSTAILLVGVLTFASRAFSSVAEEAIALRDLSVLTTFFWLALALLAVYHLLWIVYMLLLVSLFPLKFVAPK
jgi:hypothetical protein